MVCWRSVVVFVAVFASAASALHLTNRKNSRTRGFYSPTCSAFPGKRVVLVTVNMEYNDMFQNWLHHAQPFLTETEQLVTVAEDKDAGIFLRKLSATSTPQFTVIDAFNTTGAELNLYRMHRAEWVEESVHPFMTAEFFSLVRQRPDRILSFLQKDCSVLYNDIDTVWVTDPFIDIEGAGNHDLILTDDDGGMAGVVKGKGFNLCTCFIYVHPTPATIDLMSSWSSRMETQTREAKAKMLAPATGNPYNTVFWNQGPFNQALRADFESSGLVNFAVLPHHRFPAGCNANKFHDVTIYHANWMVGHDTKVNFIKGKGFWKI